VALLGTPFAASPASGQTGPAAKPNVALRTINGKPDLNGIWQALSSAQWDLEDHPPQLGIPAGFGVIDGGVIPYLPSALAQKKENFAKRATEDPVNKCFLPGVPRATYMPFPFEIAQTPQHIVIAYEYAHGVRNIYLDGSPHPDGLDFWMGVSRGRWEGDTLVVEVRNLSPNWLDRAGNFYTESVRVVERYTRTAPDHLLYEATIEDPKVFARPWKISMPLYRRLEKNIELLEYDCFVYQTEEKYKYLQ
jgi:hypothetical protein